MHHTLFPLSDHHGAERDFCARSSIQIVGRAPKPDRHPHSNFFSSTDPLAMSITLLFQIIATEARDMA